MNELNLPEKLTLANQDIDSSWINLECIWAGVMDRRIKQQLGMVFPNSVCELVKGKTLNFYVESEGLKKFINLSAEKLLTDKKLLEECKEKTIETSQNIRTFAEKSISKINKLSNPEIITLLKEIRELQLECVIYGTLVAFADVFGGISNKITEILTKRKKLKYPTNIYSKVLCLLEKTLTQKAYEDIASSKLSEYKLLEKYFWLDQGYIGRGLTKNKLSEIKEHKIIPEKLPQKEELLKELQLTEAEERIFEVSRELVLIKSLRADSRQYLNVVINKIIDKLSTELNVDSNLLEALYTGELCEVLKGNKNILKNLEQKQSHSLFIWNYDYNYKILFGGEVDAFLKERILKENLEQGDKIKGQVASPGKVRGKVKLVFGPQHIMKVSEGDILVSTATSPQLLPAMKKAGAFVTDVGGITSHAAIVSRELNKPCIVGTKVATQLLHDNDLIEVDADKGYIHIIKRAKE